MKWLLDLLERYGLSWTWDLGQQGKPLDLGDIHCIDCGVKRKDHGGKAHPFREIE